MKSAPPTFTPLSLHDALPIFPSEPNTLMACWIALTDTDASNGGLCVVPGSHKLGLRSAHRAGNEKEHDSWVIEYLMREDRKSTRLNSSHITNSYAVFCLKKKK